MATGLVSWSQTAASNASADSTVNWAEGQAPSSVNDSARAVMASAAKYRDDIAGAIVTGGTSTAYTVTSFQGFGSLSALNGMVIAFTPHTTSTNAVGVDSTINVDSLGAKPVRMQPNVALPGGTLVQGTPYIVVYNNSDGVFYLHNTINPYSIPLGGMIDFAGTTAPNSSFVLPFGQAISRTTYATFFAMVSTTYGTGDGSTTFNVPDLRGRVAAGKDDMGGSAASRLSSTSITSGGPTTLGGTGGADTTILITANLPAYTPSGTIAVNNNTSGIPVHADSGPVNIGGAGSGGTLVSQIITASFTGTAQGGTSTAFSRAMPAIIVNKLLRII